MSRDRTQYCCRECGWTTPRWAGRCGQCSEWNTLDEDVAAPRSAASAGAGGSGGRPRPSVAAVPLAEVEAGADRPIPTGIGELDRVLGGGVVPRSVTLIAGEPGIGKSTLLLQMLMAMAAGGVRTLLVSAEESAAQVRRRAARIGLVPEDMWIAADTNLASVLDAIHRLGPDLVVVDSIQTVSDPEMPGAPGSVAQVKACAQALTDDAKSEGPAVVLVGHVTKEGAIAGPRVLEHLVDTVLSFEGDRYGSLRLLRAVKHRYGPVGELGLWDMTAGGLVEMPDGAPHLLAGRRPDAPGSVVLAAMDGRRPLLVEVQALVCPPPPGAGPRRSAAGYDQGRLGQLLAVLQRRAGLVAGHLDVYVSIAGGIRVSDPAADLAVALAVASAVTGQIVPEDLAVMGEVGLGGEIRQVSDVQARLVEAVRLGFSRAVVPPGLPASAGDRPASAPTLLEAATLAGALDEHLGVAADAPRLRAVAP